MPTDFSFDVTDVSAGAAFTISINDAPCNPVHVRFSIDGVPQWSGDIAVGGNKVLTCPGGTQGKNWDVRVWCDSGAADSQSGTVG